MRGARPGGSELIEQHVFDVVELICAGGARQQLESLVVERRPATWQLVFIERGGVERLVVGALELARGPVFEQRARGWKQQLERDELEQPLELEQSLELLLELEQLEPVVFLEPATAVGRLSCVEHLAWRDRRASQGNGLAYRDEAARRPRLAVRYGDDDAG